MGILQVSLPDRFGGLNERVGVKGLPGALMLGMVSGIVATQFTSHKIASGVIIFLVGFYF